MVLMVVETSAASFAAAAAIRGDRAVNEVKLSNAISQVLAQRSEGGEAPAIAAIRAMGDDEVTGRYRGCPWLCRAG